MRPAQGSRRTWRSRCGAFPNRPEGYRPVTKRCHNGAMPENRNHEPPACAASDSAAEVVRWLSYLGAERRMSPKTVEAYRRDVFQFLAFMAEHLGDRPSLEALAQLRPADVRAFMAARRADGIGGRSLMRTLA